MDGGGRELLVLRHAKSAWPEGVADRDRPLKPRGERAARRVGRFLGVHGLRPDAALASPARRAADTARLVLEAAGADVPLQLDEKLYGADTWAAVDAVWPHVNRLLVVGHEPEMVELVTELTGAAVRLPTAGLAWLEVPGAGRSQGLLHLLLPPRLLGDDRV